VIHAAVNINCVLFLLTVVLVATNDSNKNEVKRTCSGSGADVIQENFQGQPTIKPETLCMQCTALIVHGCLT